MDRALLLEEKNRAFQKSNGPTREKGDWKERANSWRNRPEGESGSSKAIVTQPSTSTFSESKPSNVSTGEKASGGDRKLS